MTNQFLQGRTMNSQSLTICSVYPKKKTATRDYHPDMAGGRYTFVIEGAPKGQFSLLKLTDCWELIETDQGMIGNMIRRPELVRVQDIAACLLNEWAINIGGTRAGHRPGIAIIAGDQPTEAELASLNAQQNAYFDALIHEANGFASQHAWKNIQTDLHRMAAHARDYKAPWVADLGDNASKECYYCASKIELRAKFCKECRQFQPGFENLAQAIPQPEVHPMPGIPKAARAPIPPPMKAPQQAHA